MRRGSRDRFDHPFEDHLSVVVDFMLVNDVTHRLSPEAVLTQDGLHFLNEVIIKGGALDLLSTVGDWSKGGDCDECNLHLGIFPVMSLTESDWRAISGWNSAGILVCSRMA